MAAKSKISKKKMSIRLRGGAKLIASADAVPFTQEYNSWKEMAQSAKCTGENIGMRGSVVAEIKDSGTYNLYQVTQKSGVIRRIRWNGGESPKSKGRGGVKVIQELEKISANSTDLTDEQLPFLKSVIDELKIHSQPDADTNPANIVFTDPTELSANGSILERGKKIVYGHYRTQHYARWRKGKKDKETKKRENVPMINSGWFSDNKGVARPPAWQVLFAEDESYSPFAHIGLLQVCEKAYKTIEDMEWDVDPSYPIPITGKKIAEELYNNVANVKKEVDSWLANPKTSPFLKTDGNLDRKEASEAFKTVAITLEDNKDLQIIQQYIKLPIDIDTVYLDVTPTQCYNMAKLNKDYVKFLRERTYAQIVAVNRRKKKVEARQAVKDRQAKKAGTEPPKKKGVNKDV